MNLNLEKLTSVQQSLVNDLIKEFTKINPKPKDNGVRRFTFDTIAECNKEEERLQQTMTKHNETMMKVFLKQLNDETKAFKKEFGKVIDLQFGRKSGNNEYNTKENFIAENKSKPISNNDFNEIHLFFVSKTKEYGRSSDSRFNFCNDKKYFRIYVDFRRERVVYTLESGKNVTVYKIIGFTYSLNEYLYKEKAVPYSTLDELIQSEKSVQKAIVELAS